MKKIFLTVMILAAAVACSKKNDVVAGDQFQSEIRLGSVVERDAHSKAMYGNASQVLGLQFLRKDVADVTDKNYEGTIQFMGDRATTGIITFGVKQYYNADKTTSTCLTSYFPIGALANNQVAWDIDGKTDVMTSNVVCVGNETTPVKDPKLVYDHELTKVEVAFQVADGSVLTDIQTAWGDVEWINVKGTATKMFLDFNGLTVTTAVADPTTVMPMWATDYQTAFTPVALPDFGNVVSNAAAMIIPGAGETIVFEVKTAAQADVRTVVASLGKGNTFKRGNRHVITLSFKDPKQVNPIEVTASEIKEWGADGAAGAGDVQ